MKMHLHLATRDLEASVAFYRTLLLAEPTKNYGDYALFLTDEPGLELALDLDPAAKVGKGAHYGIVVATAREVEAAIARFQASGYPLEIENEETCCYAVQNKVWATDPDGRRWETYFVLAESPVERAEQAACCESGGGCGSNTNANDISARP
jgi:catechol 2,3-dioxygenase-like lactoylglutathione lyase family enzyme